MHTENAQNVVVLLFPRFSNHCLANAVEPLRAVNEFLMREAYRWEFVTIDGTAVASSSGLPVLPSRTLRDHPGGDFLFVASSYDVQRHADEASSRALREAARRFDCVVGMDTGAWIMAQAGLLDGLKATIHRDERSAFAERFPDVSVVTDRVVAAGNRMTCGGATTSFELVLDLVAHTHGEAIRREVASLFLHENTPNRVENSFPEPVSALIERCLALMAETVENPLKIGALAAELGISQRALARAFDQELGAPPSTVYKRVRLSAARRVAAGTGCSIAEIAVRCGYKNAAAMTRAFVEEFGVSPSEFRRQSRRGLRLGSTR